MKKRVLVILAVLAIFGFVYVTRAKRAAEAEAELWSEALDPAF
ncbi:MAG: DLW-39 family protein [Propionibacteriaceae bacterium]|nr:DLW-39 family protein [Propionibacteriaceae bacterium]